jgi:hypothetical protein
MGARTLVFGACLAAGLAGPAAADGLFSDAEITAVLARRAPLIAGVVTEDIPSALPREARAGTAGIGVAFVLHGPNPLSFYADPAARNVVVPGDTVLFLDDLVTVAAWFDAHGCRREWIQSYLWALLRDGEPLPRPLAAFAIDRAATVADAAVDESATKGYNGMLLYLLAHEIGHLVLGHAAGLTGAASQAQEIAADGFALDYFAAVGMPPIDMADYFVAARWLDPTGPEAALGTHPVTPGRLRAIADRLRSEPDSFTRVFADPARGRVLVLQAAAQLAQVAELLADEGMVTVAPMGLARDFPVSRLATACPS